MDTQLIIRVGRMIEETKEPLHKVAKEFGVSVSTIRRYIQRLYDINPDLANKVKLIIKYHKAIAHLRGGEATRIMHGRRKREIHSS